MKIDKSEKQWFVLYSIAMITLFAIGFLAGR